jgi:hypothetical protein
VRADFAAGNRAFDKGDYATALREWRPVAEKGDAAAQFFLGYMYDQGVGVIQDYAEAVHWYRNAADQGHATARVHLALMYEEGRGVTQDYAEAHMWFNLAASRATGDEQYKYTHGREQVAKKMTAQQIAEAQRRAREWMPRSAQRKGEWPLTMSGLSLFVVLLGLAAAMLLFRLARKKVGDQ